MTFDVTAHIFRSPQFQGVVHDAINFLNTTTIYPLPPAVQFTGAGVYTLYYTGTFAPYLPLVVANSVAYGWPIYVGKAVPPGWRTGRINLSATAVLAQRLREHARNIRQAENLVLSDFICRFILLTDVESDLIVPLEAELIRRYRPLWNTVVDGFGNHDPGSGRYNQAKSEWDVLHPGRYWATRLTGVASTEEQVLTKVQNFFDSSFS
ncbi:MAG: Eco29kI family restriction endonuclease [Chloroflexaceae bacterium]|jgi:hypothetical protein|nr:Eco29kI family restriction endonuclease [Chloroflexaceae bacterium]